MTTNRRFTLSSIILYGLMLSALVVSGQSMAFTEYTDKTGLPSSMVYFAMQDSKGYMWFGTDAGVSRFDGVNFTNYTMENGLSDNEVFKIHEDSQGRLWFLTFTGIPTIYQDGKFSPTTEINELSNIPFKSYLSTFHEDQEGNIWLGGRYYQIVKIKKDLSAFKVIPLPMPSYGLNVLPSGTINIYYVSDDRMTLHEVYIHADSARMKKTNSGDPLPGIGGVSYTTEDGNTFNGGSYGINQIFENKAVEVADLRLLFPEIYVVNFLTEDRSGSIWAGTSHGAVQLTRMENSQFQSKKFMEGYTITSIFQDREYNYWFTTDKGVFVSPMLNIKNYGSESHLNRDEILSLEVAPDGTVIAGAKKDGFYMFQNDEMTFTSLPSVNNHPAEIYSIFADKDFIILAGVIGIAIVPIHAGKIQPGLLKRYLVKHIKGEGKPVAKFDNIVKAQNGYWISTTHGSVLIPDSSIYKEKITFPYYYGQIGDAAARVFSQFVDGNDTLWFAMEDGLFKKIGDTIISVDQINDSLRGVRISAIAEDASGLIWIGTEGNGVFQWNKANLIRISERQGLAGNICNKIFIEENNVWVATTQGLSKLSSKKDSAQSHYITSYTTKDGLLGDKINDIVKVDDEVWVASTQGISAFKESHVKQQAVPPLIQIEKFGVNGNFLSTQRDHRLSPTHNSISIQFTTLSFKSRGDVRYKFRLIGQDSAWQSTHSNSIEYPTLAPGEYTFEVIGLDYRGTESETPARVSFSIDTPWSETIWARVLLQILIVSGISALGLMIFWIYRRRQQTRNQLILSEQKALRAQMNPHFIFNSLSSIQSFIVSNQKETAIDYLSDFGALVRGILQNSQSSTVSLEEELNMLRKYLNLEQLRAGNKFQFEIIVDPEIDPFDTMIPTMLIQPFLENAIWHGVMQKETEGNITLEMTLVENGVQCVVEDDGVGREVTNKSQRPKKHRSMGMAITKERLDLLNRGNKLKLHSRVIDLKSSEGKPTGTRVEIFIPIQQTA